MFFHVCHEKSRLKCDVYVFCDSLVFCLSCSTFLSFCVYKNIPIPEGDAYFTVKLQDFTAVEKDKVALDCELNKDVDVMWYHNEAEIKPSKVVTIKAEGKRRTLFISRVADKDKGQYVCDCGTDKTSATLHIKGKNQERGSLTSVETTFPNLMCTFGKSLTFSGSLPEALAPVPFATFST